MLKKIMKIIILMIICAILIVLCKNIFFIHVRADSIKASDIEVTSNSVSFTYHQIDTGYSLRSYHYYIDDETMFLSFQGTLLRQLSLKQHIQINEVYNINKIVVTDGTNNVVIWTKEKDV